ncbi:hypothetical protein BS78_10G034200 [Paspalum vaginatum]|nr:hypothetical protein BS78_10G034200 [Paspalum vaginatum]
MVSRDKNIFTAIGCSTIALIKGDIVTPIGEEEEDDDPDDDNSPFYSVSACGVFCLHDITYNSTDCTGRGCCQSKLPRNLKSFYPLFFNVSNMRAKVRDFTPCSYAFVSESDWFQYNPSYVMPGRFEKNHSLVNGAPLVLDWVVGNVSCENATKMGSSYACADEHSTCVDARTRGQGYRCNCSTGFEGNPYIAGGCQVFCMSWRLRKVCVPIVRSADINECNYPSLYCINGTCTNTNGSYNCSCPPGTHSKDPKNAPCTPIPGINKQLQVKVVVGLAISLVFLVVCIFIVMTKCERNKLAKEKDRFFKQNGGHILYQQMLSKRVDTVTIFTIDDLKKATNNFDKSRELGTGGHGIVCKGIMRDNKVVAVKRSKIIDVTQTDEFVQEIIILSQINHRNVVRLFGCCLDVEVPILVYEFIPNGTLFHLIHDNNRDGPPLSLEIRLKIAQESAEALAYLHLSTNHSIVHGDVKSLNILLDEDYAAKVTDFGASRILPKDAVQLMTMVQGTLGYLDPEYLQERKLTEKSDVYSFGVVLVELITRKTAIYFEGPGEGKSLASSFLLAMKEERVEGILDSSIMGVGLEELLEEIAKLASQCLSLKGEERPSMTQVADRLRALRNTWREILLLKHEEAQRLIERSRMDPVCDLPPSMTYTAQMMGLEIITASTADHGVGTNNMLGR